jgi:hypothetical protein
MRVLLRSTKTNLFYESGSDWTADSEAAHDFGNSARAIQFVVEWRLLNVEVVLAFDDPHYNIRLPLNRPDPPYRIRE